MSAQKPIWPDYQPEEIESRWQSLWKKSDLYLIHEDELKPKYYCLDFFPYPSGEGLHVGHCRNYVPTDVYSRYQRLRGYNVLHPFGWDAFGEPTEQFAIAHGIDPRTTTRQNTANFRRQLEILGTSYDWSRELWSSDPTYYRWTQWFFLLMVRRGLAYRDSNWQWWCPTCQTTLSSHETVNGICWRGHHGVTRREIPAWYFRITAYAEQLLQGLDRIDWPEPIKAMQRNWIGRSEGIKITFPIHKTSVDEIGLAKSVVIEAFTTRPDTLFGVTFLALAPENPLTGVIITPEHKAEVESYCLKASARSEVERMDEAIPKTGVFTGVYARHPLSEAAIPIWVSDYVLPGYATGAVMGVPAHDRRDFDFARHFHLPVRVVVAPPGWQGEPLEQAYTEDGTLTDSMEFTGSDSRTAASRISQKLEQSKLGSRQVQYRMRDWLISRQRYWGTPIPIIHCEVCGQNPVSETNLPVLLPEMEDYRPDGSGRSPLARVPGFVNTSCPRCGGLAKRETDTMGGFACSSWYFLRFANPHYHSAPFDPVAVKYWLPVDLYIGGAEHAVLHLLYARFWTKVFYNEGLISFDEPFTRLVNQGQLMGVDGVRMSKSRGNVITPDSVIKEFGADALRLYVMFIAPFDQDANWTLDGIHGTRRFLNRLWMISAQTFIPSVQGKAPDPELAASLHQTIRGVTERLEQFRFNTAIALLMEFVNLLYDRFHQGKWQTSTFHTALEAVLKLLAPFAPHITEEIWARTGHTGSIHAGSWPDWDPNWVKSEGMAIAVQVNGKLRDVLEVSVDISQEELTELARANTKVAILLGNNPVKKTIYVPGKIINFVT